MPKSPLLSVIPSHVPDLGTDEPTSGLDSQTAWSICMLLRKLADNGQAILCTIHQPSSQLFCIFDRLLLLNEQGQNIYFGDIGHNSTTLISYFEENGAERCEYDANPAEWMLHVSTKVNEAENTSASGYWAEIWSSSLQKEEVLHHIAQLRRVSDTAQAVHQGEYAVSWTKQLVVVTRRLFQNYWRDPMYLYSKLVLCAGVVGLASLFQLVGLSYSRFSTGSFQRFILPKCSVGCPGPTESDLFHVSAHPNVRHRGPAGDPPLHSRPSLVRGTRKSVQNLLLDCIYHLQHRRRTRMADRGRRSGLCRLVLPDRTLAQR